MFGEFNSKGKRRAAYLSRKKEGEIKQALIQIKKEKRSPRCRRHKTRRKGREHSSAGKKGVENL